MFISSLSQSLPTISAGDNSQSKIVQQSVQRNPSAQAVVTITDNNGQLMVAARDYAKVERVDLNLVRESNIPLQNQRAIATYSAAANIVGQGGGASGMLDLFA